jgi:hypothetical protein
MLIGTGNISMRPALRERCGSCPACRHLANLQGLSHCVKGQFAAQVAAEEVGAPWRGTIGLRHIDESPVRHLLFSGTGSLSDLQRDGTRRRWESSWTVGGNWQLTQERSRGYRRLRHISIFRN